MIRSRFRFYSRPRIVVALLALLATSGAAEAQSSNRIVSANPHDRNILISGGPMPSVAGSSQIDVNAYHVKNVTEINAINSLSAYGKPTIYSTDVKKLTASQIDPMIKKVCDNNDHFEYFDGYLSDKAKTGVKIAGAGTFPSQSKNVLKKLRDEGCASDLEPNGVLSRNAVAFEWTPPSGPKHQVTLVGHSWMGAVVTPNARVSFDNYLNVLQSYDINLTRIWVIEQWSAYAVDKNPNPTDGYTPFGRNSNRGSWSLASVDTAFLTRLQQFVSKAWSRGIVVQVTLFDRHGLLDKEANLARWQGSPYNRANNVPFTVSGQQYDLFSLPSGCTDYPPQDFVRTTGGFASENADFIEAVVDSLDGYGNVIFEIINEPVGRLTKQLCSCCDWQMGEVIGWHNWVASTVKNAP